MKYKVGIAYIRVTTELLLSYTGATTKQHRYNSGITLTVPIVGMEVL